MERVNLFFLHGFLGRPHDWQAVKSYLPQSQNIKIFAVDYFSDEHLSPANDFGTWAKNFSKWVAQHTLANDRNVLVGYSLGGRLAMHALDENPDLWQQVILISANPGFNDDHDSLEPSSEERTQRWLNDSYWAEEFLKAPWDMLVKNWNAQPVFEGGSEEPSRSEKDFSRELLSLALTQWSLSQQKNMRSLLAKYSEKTLCLVGDRDSKFLNMTRALQDEIPALRYEAVKSSSHRVLFDNPKAIADKIRHLVSESL